MNLTQLRIPGFSGYSVAFSPYHEYRLAVASSQHFGIVGNGKLVIFDLNKNNQLVPIRQYDTQDSLFETSWSEINEHQIIGCCGDGSIKLWDMTVPDLPVQLFHEHTREVYGLSWNLKRKDCFVSGSWDNTIKVWDPLRPQSVLTFTEHTYCIYATNWAPHHPDVFASASGDCSIKIWDTKSPHSVQTIRAHESEILTCDWSKYQENLLVTGSVDKSIKVFDLRFPNKEIKAFFGHGYAVRKVKFSPHHANVIGSVSYDMTTRFWNMDLNNPAPVQAESLFVYDRHTEFVAGLDFNIFVEGMVAACSWDEIVHVFNVPFQKLLQGR